MSFTQTLNTIKLKYAININLTTLDVTYNPNKHNWSEKTKKKQLFQRKNIKFEMQRSEFWERQFLNFTFFFTSQNFILP